MQKKTKKSNTIRLLLRLCHNRMFTFTLTNASKTESQQIQSQCFILSKYSDLYYILPASSYSTVCRQAKHDETAVRPRQEVRGRAKAKTQLMRPSRDRGRKAEARPSRGRAEARQAGKLPRGGLEARQLPRGLHHCKELHCMSAGQLVQAVSRRPETQTTHVTLTFDLDIQF